ncbi:hypothetical protein HC891_14260 [Candidatus Gracilibacteria bacterium]|nr:hypothetical protein [Candidatus Gracilibacteria bacterium]
MTTLTGRASAWAVSTRSIVYMAIGAALYGVLGWATSFLRIPGPFNSQIRPAIVIPMFFGALFGPWVGFFAGFVGNIIIDLIAGYGFSWNWSLANGLLGLISGLAFARARGEELPSLTQVLLFAIGGNLIAFLLPASPTSGFMAPTRHSSLCSTSAGSCRISSPPSCYCRFCTSAINKSKIVADAKNDMVGA